MKNQRGFAVIETILILIIIVIIGGVVWYVIKQNQEANESISPNNTSQTEQTIEEYKLETTVPDDWKTYKNEEYKISFAHPNDWNVKLNTVKKDKPDSQNIYSDNAEEVIIFGINSPDAVQYSDVLIEAFRQPVEQSVDQMKKYYENSNKEQLEGEPPIKFVSKEISFQGKKAFKTTTKQTLRDSGEVVTTIQYLVESNGYTLALPSIDPHYLADPQATSNVNYISQVIVDSIKFL